MGLGRSEKDGGEKLKLISTQRLPKQWIQYQCVGVKIKIHPGGVISSN